MEKNNVLDRLVSRLQRIGVEVELTGNYPWIYLNKINGVRVTEKFQGNHGFTVAFLPIRNDQKMEITDIGEVFKIIRKYNDR
jgi:hypothetical protein